MRAATHTHITHICMRPVPRQPPQRQTADSSQDLSISAQLFLPRILRRRALRSSGRGRPVLPPAFAVVWRGAGGAPNPPLRALRPGPLALEPCLCFAFDTLTGFFPPAPSVRRPGGPPPRPFCSATVLSCSFLAQPTPTRCRRPSAPPGRRPLRRRPVLSCDEGAAQRAAGAGRFSPGRVLPPLAVPLAARPALPPATPLRASALDLGRGSGGRSGGRARPPAALAHGMHGRARARALSRAACMYTTYSAAPHMHSCPPLRLPTPVFFISLAGRGLAAGPPAPRAGAHSRGPGWPGPCRPLAASVAPAPAPSHLPARPPPAPARRPMWRAAPGP